MQYFFSFFCAVSAALFASTSYISVLFDAGGLRAAKSESECVCVCGELQPVCMYEGEGTLAACVMVRIRASAFSFGPEKSVYDHSDML